MKKRRIQPPTPPPVLVVGVVMGSPGCRGHVKEIAIAGNSAAMNANAIPRNISAKPKRM